VGTYALHEIIFRAKIIPHVFVGNVEVSNLSAEEAADFVKKDAIGKSNRAKAVIVSRGETVKIVEANDIGFEYKVEEAVSRAWNLGRNINPIERLASRIRVLLRPEKIALEYKFDQEALEVLVASLASDMDKPGKEPVLLVGQTKPIEVTLDRGTKGVVLDREDLSRKIVEAILSSEQTTVTAKLVTKEFVISAEDEKALLTKANRLANSKLILESESYQKTLNGEELVGLIGIKEAWNQKLFEELTKDVASDLNREPQNARFEFRNDRLVDFSADVTGIEVDEAKLVSQLKETLDRGGDKQIVPVSRHEAKIKTSDVNNLGISQLLGEGRSTYSHSIPGRVHNVALAASRINGTLVAPGEVFSFNQALGDVSAETGYKSAYIIKEGRTVLGDGGGVCQVSTTTFRAALKVGLPIVERRAHAYRVSYYEQDSKPGIDATVFSPSTDLKFKNDTPKYLLIQTVVDSKKTNMSVRIYGTSDGRQATVSEPKIFSQTPPPPDLIIDDPTLAAGTMTQIDWKAWGAKVAFDYKVERNGEVIFKKTFSSTYQPWQSVFLKGTRI